MAPSSHTAFQSPRALARLNIAAVGLALAAATGAVLGALFEGAPLAVLALPSVVVGSLWAWALRIPRTVRGTQLRWGWLASVPLAALNAALTCGLMFAFERPQVSVIGPFVFGAVAGATVGGMIWVPALIATLVCFGAPIASAQRLARLGLAGEERGEVRVGAASAAVALAALALLAVQPLNAVVAHRPAGAALLVALGLLGAGAGGAAALLGRARGRRRRAFVAQAEAGRVPGYRVDATPEGKVLIRVVSQGEGYRVADFEQEVSAVDAEGNVADVDRAARVVGRG